MRDVRTSTRFAGNVVMVTGATRGIGRATALAFAHAGARVALAGRTVGDLEAVEAECRAAGADTLAVAVDVADATAVARFVAATEQQLGPIDVLVNNAGILGPLGPLAEADPREWLRTFAINLGGAFVCTRFVLPAMVARRSGCILNVSSASGERVVARRSAYATSKAALNHLTRVLAAEVAGHGVRVLALYPSPTESWMQARLRAASPRAVSAADVRRFRDHEASGQLGSPERAAACIIALAGPAGAPFVGQVVDLREAELRDRLLAAVDYAGPLYAQPGIEDIT